MKKNLRYWQKQPSGSAHGTKGLNSAEEEEKPLELVHTQSVLIRIENIYIFPIKNNSLQM